MLFFTIPVMSFLRRRLSWLLTGWLVFQIAGVIMPVALAAAGHGHDELVCTCPAGGHESCPMHHNSDRPRSEQTPTCVLQNAAVPVDLALLALASGGGILPQSVVLDTGLGPVTGLFAPSLPVTSRTELPTSPPPRA